MRATKRIAGWTGLILVGLLLAGARGQSAPPAPPSATGPQEVSVMGVFVDPATQSPMVVLEGKRDKRSFAMAIGPAEALGIAVPLQNVAPPRPLTHDLFITLFGRLNVKVDKVVITDLRESTYFALVYLTSSGGTLELDSRPSDAIALAIRAKAPVYAEDRVFAKAGQLSPTPRSSGPRI